MSVFDEMPVDGRSAFDVADGKTDVVVDKALFGRGAEADV